MTGILVDTSIWSLALRKKERTDLEEKIVLRLTKIVRDFHLVIIGPIRQEILSGISDERKYEELRQKMGIFPDHEIRTHEYDLAAKFHNECRRNGVQGSHVDYLICAVAHSNDYSVFTLDKDFKQYQEFIQIQVEMIDV